MSFWRRRPTLRPSSPRSPPRKRWRNPPSCSRSQARVRAGGRKVPMGALDQPLSVPHRYGSEPSSWTPKSQRERRSRPTAQPLRRSGGVAGPRTPGRQPASRRTAKQQSQRAPLHPKPGMGQAGKGQSARGREMAAYLRGNLRSAVDDQPATRRLSPSLRKAPTKVRFEVRQARPPLRASPPPTKATV